ncbi:MAG TPA: arylamine N-acetyltransferase [Firmicutes bacterium]|nr:arylamine N-acetyltransferase [Bacillota bacterium]
MANDSFNITAYLKRINYQGSLDVSFATLRGLHIAHVTNIPFENIDVYLGRPIKLDRKSLFNKLVVNKRGGYCFEMNGLFSIALKELGFTVRDLLARGTIDGVNYMSRTHQVLVVEIGDQRYMADVGYGNDGIREPLLLEEGLEQRQFTDTYRFKKDKRYGYILQKKAGKEFRPLYAFTLEECCPEDFLMSNHYTSTYPDSFFRMARVCTMPTLDGRITLFANELKILADGELTKRVIKDEDDFRQVMKDYFKLDFDAISKD